MIRGVYYKGRKSLIKGGVFEQEIEKAYVNYFKVYVAY